MNTKDAIMMKSGLKVLLLKRHSLPKKSKMQSLKRTDAGFKMLVALFSGIVLSSQAMAGGAMTGGASEWTQIMNNFTLVTQYAQQIEQYSTQLRQYQAQLQNLQRNPTSSVGADTTRLINGIGGIMDAGESIGGTMSQIDGNFSKKFNNPQLGNYSQSFKAWTSASQDTLGATMRASGMHRDAYDTDTQALQALFNKSQSSDGTVAAVQQLSAINTMQIQQTQKLGDLLATQNIASSTYMAAQNSKQQAAYDKNRTLMKTPPQATPNPADYKDRI